MERRRARPDPPPPPQLRYLRPPMPDHVFYDGDCGFCHRSVRFLAAHDREGAFRYARLGGPTFEALVPAERRADLPDSLVVYAPGAGLLVRSDALLHCLRRLGPGFRALAALIALRPRTAAHAA